MPDEDRSAQVKIEHGGNTPWLPDWRSGYALPSRFSASIDAEWLAYRVELELEAGAESTIRCVGLTLSARDGGKAVTAREMRTVPLGECIQLATSAALRPAERTEDALTIHFRPTDATAAWQAASRGPQRRVTDELLQEVADIYLAAEHKPTNAVRWQHSRRPSYSTAARWVMEARKRGLIPPTKETKR